MATTRQPRRSKKTQRLTRARTTAPAERKPRRAVKILDPTLKERLALKGSTVEERSAEANARILASAEKRGRGRPKGTGQGRTTKDYKVALPLDLVPDVEAQPNKSAFFVDAVRHYLAFHKSPDNLGSSLPLRPVRSDSNGAPRPTGGAMSDAAIDYATLHTDAVQPEPDCRRCGKHPARYGKDGMCGGCHKAAQWAAAHGRLDKFLRASGRQ